MKFWDSITEYATNILIAALSGGSGLIGGRKMMVKRQISKHEHAITNLRNELKAISDKVQDNSTMIIILKEEMKANREVDKLLREDVNERFTEVKGLLNRLLDLHLQRRKP